MRYLLAVLAPLVCLTACATERSVEGRLLHAPETFTGTASSATDNGSLSISSSTGAKCSGRYMGSATIGSSVAVITCDDGRAGSVIFLDSAGRSVGTGVLGTDAITLTIEN